MENAHREPQLEPAATTWSVLATAAAERPEAVGFVARFGDDTERAVTYREWHEQVRALAGGLAHRYGVAPGDRVVWLLGNPEAGQALLLYHALGLLGAISVPVNPRTSPAELGSVVATCQPRLCLAADRLAALVDAALPGNGIPKLLLAAGAADPGAIAGDHPVPDPAGRADDPVVLLFTSGTSGRPKGVVHTHRSALAAGAGWAGCFRLTEQDRYQSPFPIFSGAGLHFSGLACLLAGTTYLPEEFEAGATVARLARSGATVFAAVPTVYQLLVDRASEAFTGERLPALRLFDYGGAPMPVGLVRELAARFPAVALVQTYGLTEAGPGGTYLPAEHALSKLGALGLRPAGQHTRLRVVDEQLRDVPHGTPGELLISGPAVMAGYYRDPEATAEVLRDGWLRTGDIVRRDADGFLYYLDRRKDLIIRGGYNVSSIQVEEVLRQHPQVADAAVVGVPDPVLGEEIAAFVVPVAGARPAATALIDHCAARLADYQVPRRVLLTDELPRNTAGKVLKRALRDRISADAAPPKGNA
ncbi:MAG TPA: AMP-binding protein [Natronosporangium sp.]